MSNGTKLVALILWHSYKPSSRQRYRSVTHRGSAGGRQAAQRDRDPQDEAVPADRRRVLGELGHAPQPVAHGVRVYEQQPRGGLQRRALLKVRGERVEQGV